MAKQQTPKKPNTSKPDSGSSKQNFGREGAGTSRGSGTSTRPKKDQK